MPEDTIAGYRILRKLGSGSRADVYLGHASALASSGVNATAALKCFRADAPDESIDAELRALSSIDHPHVVQLRDVSRTGPAAPTLILEQLERGSLGHLLASRSTIGAGEAVTLLAPLAAAVLAVHESGFTHGSIAASRVLFRGSGAPVLSGFGSAATAHPAGCEADNRSFASLALAALDRVPAASHLREWFAALSVYPDALLSEFSARLFELAEATPVRFAADSTQVSNIPGRVVATLRVESHGQVGPRGQVEPVVPVELRERVEPVETKAPTLMTALAKRARAAAAPYLDRVPPRFRKPKYAAVAAGVAALLVAIAVVPAGGGTAALTPILAPTPAAAGAVVEDDPVAAFAELVPARNQCVRDLSILCLDTVLQENSAAMDDDVALIQSIERGDGGTAVLRPLNVEVGERMGDAVLLTYQHGPEGEPASALLVKGEAGWRIRTYVAG